MLINKVSADTYMSEFSKKFSNFCNKSPVLLSFAVQPDKVTVVHSNSQTKYHFPWDFTMPIKSFIYTIKQQLVENHYPRLIEVIREQVPLTRKRKQTF
jgi:hypothetical protein